LFVSGNEWRRRDSEMEPQEGRRNDVQTVGLNAETKKVSAPSRRGDISLDIRFYRTLTVSALIKHLVQLSAGASFWTHDLGC